ncbi:hypothetical protein IP91_04255 [Pseudoduganella lurida]|uniref:Uncharacterized protein n=1 Tax=Pseudoduganella lurida TaxID=1036180 RepID=A0A562R187_9BURK|nr:hypothetical protein [Pseudoduganella lurida]TWI62146.1 hypothetical protein IP91_04255 [Pseudoduganella lurida]
MTYAINAVKRVSAEGSVSLSRLASSLGAFARRALEQAGAPYVDGHLPPH